MSDEVLRALNTLFEPGHVVEVRAITDEGMASGYFDDFSRLAESVVPLDAAGTQGIYVTLNEVNPALLSRRANRIKGRLSKKDSTTADSDIISRRWFPIDIDPVRPSGVSSTDEEHQAALVQAAEISAYLGRERGWPAPVFADSGNGAHLLYRIDLPNDDESRELVKRCLDVLDMLFSNGNCSIDAANFNAARIWKLYGTVSRKGDHTEERPHRRARLFDVPDRMGTVSREMLEDLARLLPASPPPGRPPGKSLDLGAWLREHGIAVRAEKPYQGGTLYVLEECPFSGAHRDGAFAIQFGNGAIFAGCHHASCGGGAQRWKELRERFEKGKKIRQSPSPPPERPPETSPPDAGIREEAMQLLREGDPLAFMLQTFALDHVGDETVATCLVMSLASRSVINTNGLHVSVTGESGKGKSHAFATMLRQVPERFRLKGAMSNKALFYLDDMQPGSVIVLDDTTLSEEVQEILKSATTSFREPIEYRTVTKERKVKVCTIPERCVWWVAKVEGSGDDQVLNRMLTCWIDDSPEQDSRVLSRILEKDESVPTATVRERREVVLCQALWDILRSRRMFVVIPFARRIRFSNAANRRNPEMLLDLIKAHALLRCMQREATGAEDGSPCILATREDFADAVRLYDHLNGTAGGQETKLTKVEAGVLGLVAKAGWSEFTIQQLQQVTGRSSSNIRKVMNGYVSRGYTYSGLLEKCPAISFSDRTVVTNDEPGLSVKRRAIAYQFNADIYRQWAKGGSCWLDSDDHHHGHDDDQDLDDEHDDNHDRGDKAERRNEADERAENSTHRSGPDSLSPGRKGERSLSVHNNGRKNSGSEQQDEAGIHDSSSVCYSGFSTQEIDNAENVGNPGVSTPLDGDLLGGSVRTNSAPAELSLLGPLVRPRASDFKKLDVIRKGRCDACGMKKYLTHIEKLTERRKKLPPTEPAYLICRECYEEAVQRERTSAPPLPGLIDVDRLERVSVEIGRCSVCGLEKSVWRDKESGVNLCEGCWERERREGGVSPDKTLNAGKDE